MPITEDELRPLVEACRQFSEGVEHIAVALAHHYETEVAPAIENAAADIYRSMSRVVLPTFADLEWAMMTKAQRRRWCLRLIREAKHSH